MAYEHREGQGSLFRNTKKEGKQPDYRGTIMLDGKVWEIAGWIKEGAKGNFLSLKGQEPQEREPRGGKRDEFKPRTADDPIPF